MITSPAVIDAILARRSASPRSLAEPVPSADQLALLVRAAAAAPDHKLLRPLRFILVPAGKRAELADGFRAAKRERDPGATPEEIEQAGQKAFRGPMLLAIVLRIVRDHPRVSISDQMITAGAAIENVLLAAAALGYGACLRSGQSATSRRVRETMRLAGDEELAGFLILGTLTREPKPRADDTDGLLSVWE